MSAHSMFLDGRGVSHGDPACEHARSETFRCANCKRRICYCGGHGGDGTPTSPCETHCDDCCPCDGEVAS